MSGVPTLKSHTGSGHASIASLSLTNIEGSKYFIFSEYKLNTSFTNVGLSAGLSELTGKQLPPRAFPFTIAAVTAPAASFLAEIFQHILPQASINLAISCHFIKPVRVTAMYDPTIPLGEPLVFFRALNKKLRRFNIVVSK